MKIRNQSRIPTEQLRPWLAAGAVGFNSARVLVAVIDEDANSRKWWGIARRSMSSAEYCQANGIKGKVDYVVEIKIPSDRGRPKRWNGQGLKGFVRRWSKGVPVESMADWVVALAAHEFRHVQQFRKRRQAINAGRNPKQVGELDAELWAVSRLNKHRAATGRDAVLPRAGKPPFGPPGRVGLIVADDDRFGVMYYAHHGYWDCDRSKAARVGADVRGQAAMNRAMSSMGCRKTRLRYEIVDWGRLPARED